MKKSFKNQAGLTLIEVLVAIGIFGLVINMIFSVFMIVVMSQRRIVAIRNVEDNIRFSMESLSREVRTGNNFSVSGVGDSMVLSFTNFKKESVVYRLNGGVFEKSFDGGINFINITGSEVSVDYLKFNLIGEGVGDKLQPRITVTIGATSFVGGQSGNLKMQTTIGQRLLQS